MDSNVINMISIGSKPHKKSQVKIETCHSVSEFFDNVNRFESQIEHSAWYRGQNSWIENGERKNYSQPKIFRNQYINGTNIECSTLDESHIFINIERRMPYLHGKEATFPDIIALAQHLKFPTRMLDFSESLGTALYFSIPNKLSDPVITLINPVFINQISNYKRNNISIHTWENDHDYFNFIKKDAFSNTIYRNNHDLVDDYILRMHQDENDNNPEYSVPIAFYPKYVKHRMFLQQSAFLLFGSDKRPLEDILEEFPQNIVDHAILKLEFSKDQEKRKRVLFELQYALPTAVQIFGDEDGLFDDIINEEIWSRPA